MSENEMLEAHDEEEEMPMPFSRIHVRMARERREAKEKNKPLIESFLGKGALVSDSVVLPKYYCGLLAWALKGFMAADGWKIVHVLGVHEKDPVFGKVETGPEMDENLITDGQFLIQKGRTKLVATIDLRQNWRAAVIATGAARNERAIRKFTEELKTFADANNPYRGAKLEFNGDLHVLNLKDKSWDSVILDADIKQEIRANTVDFLKKAPLWQNYGIAPRRGVMLAGEPGTGKTVLCKAIMADSQGITCISVNAYVMDANEYLSDLYALARDLKPCIVFIEDIDLIGLSRDEFGYNRGNALVSLLAELDGVEEMENVVTVATTNCLDMLDKALSQRPSRFDRVIKLSRPALAERREIVRRVCTKIPISDNLQEYAAVKGDGCTPAQIQEVIHCLVIERCSEETGGISGLKEADVDYVISRMKGKYGQRLGFAPANSGASGGAAYSVNKKT